MVIIAIVWALSYVSIRNSTLWIQQIAPVILGIWAAFGAVGIICWSIGRVIRRRRTRSS